MVEVYVVIMAEKGCWDRRLLVKDHRSIKNIKMQRVEWSKAAKGAKIGLRKVLCVNNTAVDTIIKSQVCSSTW